MSKSKIRLPMQQQAIMDEFEAGGRQRKLWLLIYGSPHPVIADTWKVTTDPDDSRLYIVSYERDNLTLVLPLDEVAVVRFMSHY